MEQNAHVIAYWHHELHAPKLPYTHQDLYRMWKAQSRLTVAMMDARN